MPDFICYWLHCAHTGWEIGHGIFWNIEGVTILLSAGFLCHRKLSKHRSTLEDNAMKWAFHIFWVSFVVSTVFVAPFLQDREQSNKAKERTESVAGFSNKVVELTVDAQRKDALIQSNNNTIQIQFATITAYQVENAILNRKLSDIEFASDPSAKAVKKRVLILAGQIHDWLKQANMDESTHLPSLLDYLNKGTALVDSLKGQTNVDVNSRLSALHWDEQTQLYQFLQTQMLDFEIQFGGRLAGIRNQLDGLGYKTPSIDDLLTNHIMREQFNAIWEHHGWTWRPHVEAEKELQDLANQIKE